MSEMKEEVSPLIRNRFWMGQALGIQGLGGMWNRKEVDLQSLHSVWPKRQLMETESSAHSLLFLERSITGSVVSCPC